MAASPEPRFDPDQAKAKRPRDIRRADRGADDDWRDEALATIEQVARKRPLLTTDHVLDANPALEGAREPRCWGPMMLRAAREGWIEPTDRYVISSRRQSNARHKRAWVSLLYGDRPRHRRRDLDIVREVLP